jgi:hypothetical protein
MKLNIVKKGVTSALVAVILLFGAWSTTASAQVRVQRPRRVVVVQRPFFFPHYYYPNSYYRVYDPIAYQREQGYSDGHSRGKDDAKHGLANDPNSHKHYRNSDSINYKEAFAQGYADGYRERMG